MEPHRHRIHPLLFEALLEAGPDHPPEVQRQARLWQENRKSYEARRPVWSVTGARPPWETVTR